MNAFTFDLSREILLGVDRLAELMAAELLHRFGPVRVLISLRGSTYNARQVQEVLDWARGFQRQQDYDFVQTVNTAFNLKNVYIYTYIYTYIYIYKIGRAHVLTPVT